MTSEYDPKLQALFTQAEQAPDHDAFARSVMARIDQTRRRTLLLWAVAAAVAIGCLAFLAAPLVSAIVLLSNLLPTELVAIDSGWLKLLLSPVNSVAAAIAVGALALRKFYKMIFR